MNTSPKGLTEAKALNQRKEPTLDVSTLPKLIAKLIAPAASIDEQRRTGRLLKFP
jgi:hypothetical protein